MPSPLPPGTTHQTWRKGRTAHLLAAGEYTTRWNTLNRLGSRDCQSLSEFGLRSGYTQQGLMLRKTEPARRSLLLLLSSCFSAPPQSWPVQDPRPVKQAGHRPWLGDYGEPGCGSGNFCQLSGQDQKLQTSHSGPALPDA